MTSKPALTKLIESFRDWGRDCWCAPQRQHLRQALRVAARPAPLRIRPQVHLFAHWLHLKLSDCQAASGVFTAQETSGFIAARKATSSASTPTQRPSGVLRSAPGHART